MPNLPPARLADAPTFVRRLLLAFWSLLFVLGLITVTIGTRDMVRARTAESASLAAAAPFMRLGFQQPVDCCLMQVAPGVAQTAGLYEVGEITRVGDTRIDPASMTLDQLAALLDQPEGTEIPITYNYNDFENGDGSPVDANVTLRVSEEDRMRALAFKQQLPSFVALRDIIVWLGVIAQFLALGVSALIVARKRRDTISFVLAFSLLGLVLFNPSWEGFVYGLELGQYYEPLYGPWFENFIGQTAQLLVLIPLYIALPAYPDGRYTPRWTAWIALLGPLLALASVFGWEYLPVNTSSVLPALMLVLLGVGALMRFRRTPPGVEKQQLKWVAFGLGFGVLAIAIQLILDAVSYRQLWYVDDFGNARAGILPMAGIIATELIGVIGRILIPLGLLMSIMKWRLNDADSAIGRSTAYATITLLIGALWATMTVWVNRMLGDALGPNGAAGLSTVIAGAVLVPTRERTLKWTEKKFQPALVRMRALPAKLTPWKHDHDPADLARGALNAIVRGVDASSGAIALRQGDGWLPVATHEVSETSVIEQLEREQPDPDIFPLRVDLDDIGGQVGVLLLGPRGDGASYNTDEKKAIDVIETPLAEALRATSRRAQRNGELARMLSALEARIARVEAEPRMAGA